MKDNRIRIHDFRRKEYGETKKLFFDVVLPQEIYFEKEIEVKGTGEAMPRPFIVITPSWRAG